jgi:hypothetical protein
MAEREIGLDKLTSLADQPKIVQGEDDGNVARLCHADQICRQTGEMVKMYDIGTGLIEKLVEPAIDQIVAITPAEGVAALEIVVDLDNGKPVIRAGGQGILFEARICNPIKDGDRVPLC